MVATEEKSDHVPAMTDAADAPTPSETPELDTLPEVAPGAPGAVVAADAALDGRIGAVMPPGFAELKRAIMLLSLGSLVSITAPFFLCIAVGVGAVSTNEPELLRYVWLTWAVLLPLTAVAGGFAVAKAVKMKRDYGVFPEVAWLAVFTLLGVPGGVFWLLKALELV